MQNKINILAVDDEQIVIDSIRKHLRNESEYNMITSQSAEEALSILDKESINIILTDLMMPEMDGLEFLQVLKDRKHPAIVIMITGYATINTAMQAMQLGAFDYIAKPFTKDELRKVVRRAAELVSAGFETQSDISNEQDALIHNDKQNQLKGIGRDAWMVMQDDGTVLIGIERAMLLSIGRVQTIYLPSKGDEIRQGSTFFQLFSSDMRSHNLQSPLSGIVFEVNQKVLTDPNKILNDPYGDGWLIRIEPTKFEEEIKIIGLL